jgi:putative hydrolase of the HAD superfamily
MTPPIELVLVDFDDTLVDTAPRFQNARRAFYRLLADAGLPPETAIRIHDEQVDPRMRLKFGLGPHRIEHAFSETYVALCRELDADLDHALLTEISGIARAVPGTPPCIDGAIIALARLAATHNTVVYTQSGVPEYQLECVRGAGVLEVLPHERIRICAEKNADEFRRVMAEHDVSRPDAAWMIGNSMRADINPALEAGANAILVEVDDPWHHDHAEPLSDRFHRVRRFPQAVGLLETFSR